MAGASVLDSLPQRCLTGKNAKGTQNLSSLTYTFIDDVDAQVTGMFEKQKEETTEDQARWQESMDQNMRDASEYKAAFSAAATRRVPPKVDVLPRPPASLAPLPKAKMPNFVKVRAALKVKANDDKTVEIAAAAVAAGKRAAESMGASKSWAKEELRLRHQAKAARLTQERLRERGEELAAAAAGESADASPPRQRMPAAVGSQNRVERSPLARRGRRAAGRPSDDGSADRSRSPDERSRRFEWEQDDHNSRQVQRPQETEAQRRERLLNEIRAGREERHRQLAEGREQTARASATQNAAVADLGWDKIQGMVREQLDPNNGMRGKKLKLGKKKKKLGKGKGKGKGRWKRKVKPSSSSSSSSSSIKEKKKKKDKKKKKGDQESAAPEPGSSTVVMDLDSDLECCESESDLEVVSSAIAQPVGQTGEQPAGKKEKKEKKQKKEKKEKKLKPKMAAAVTTEVAPAPICSSPAAPKASPAKAAGAVPAPKGGPSVPAPPKAAPPVGSPPKATAPPKPVPFHQTHSRVAPQPAAFKPVAFRPEI